MASWAYNPTIDPETEDPVQRANRERLRRIQVQPTQAPVQQPTQQGGVPWSAFWGNQYAPPMPQVQAPTLQQSIYYGGLTKQQYDDLPWHKKMAINIFTPTATPLGTIGGGLKTGAVIGGLMGAPAGPGGVISGAVLGAGLANKAEKSPNFAKWMMYLDYPEQFIERIFGMLDLTSTGFVRGVQKGGLPGGIDAAAEILDNLPAAWKAASTFYEALELPLWNQAWGGPAAPGKQTWLTDEQMGYDAQKEAFDRIVYKGENPDDVLADYIGRYNVEGKPDVESRFGFEGQMRGLIGGIILDPMNWIGGWLVKGIGLSADVMKAFGMLDEKAWKAMNLATEATVASRRGPIRQAQLYFGELPRIKTAEELSQMSAVSRYLAGITPEGMQKIFTEAPKEITTGKRIAGALTAAAPFSAVGTYLFGPLGALAGVPFAYQGWKKGLDYLTHMLPEARAAHLAETAGYHASEILLAGQGDPVTAAKYVKMLGRTPTELAATLGNRVFGSSEGAAVSDVFRGLEDAVDAHLTTWTDAEAMRLRPIVAEVAQRIGDDPYHMLQEIKKNGARVTDQLYHSKGGDAKVTAETLAQAVAKFVDEKIPLTNAEWHAQLVNILERGTADYAVKRFNIAPESAFIRTGKMIKAVQYLPILGLNPNTAITNILSNYFTAIADGSFGLISRSRVEKFWADIGYQPSRLAAGFGIASEGKLPLEAVREAMRTDDFIQKTTDFMGNANDKLGVIGKFSQKGESLASEQVTTTLMKRIYPQLNKRGVGFDPMPAALEARLRAIDPYLPEALYSAVENSYNWKDVEAKLNMAEARTTLDEVITPAAEAAGIKPDEWKEFMHSTGVYDSLNDDLMAAKTDADVAKAYGKVFKQVEDYLNDQSQKRLKIEQTQAMQAVTTEGMQNAYLQFDDQMLAFVEQNFNHEMHMDQTAQRAEVLRIQGGNAGAVWDAELTKANNDWARLNRRQQAQTLGIAEAMGIQNAESSGILLNKINVDDTWRKYFDGRNERIRQVKAGKITWDEAKAQNTAEYIKATQGIEKLYDAMDAALVKMYGDWADTHGVNRASLEASAVEWRAGVKNIRTQMYQDVINYRAQMNRPWRDFWKEYQAKLIQMLQLNRDKAAQVYREATGVEPPTVRPEPVAPEFTGLTDWELAHPGETPPIEVAQPAPGVVEGVAEAVTPIVEAPIAQPPGWADEVARKAQAAGIKANQHLINYVNKYSGEAVTKFDEITPAMMDRAAANKLNADIQTKEAVKVRLAEMAADVEKPLSAPAAGDARAFYQEKWLRELMEYSDDQIEINMAIADAQAQTWAKYTGRPASEWYEEWIGGAQEGGKGMEQAKKGAVSLDENGKVILHAFQAKDATTAVHELGHIWWLSMNRVMADTGDAALKADVETARKWMVDEAARKGKPIAIDDAGEVTETGHELWARAIERYFTDGIAPIPELTQLFERFKRWMLSIYTNITGSEIDVNITPELRKVFDRLLDEDAGKVEPEASWIKTDSGAKRPLTPSDAILQDNDGTPIIKGVNITAPIETAQAFPPELLAKIAKEKPGRWGYTKTQVEYISNKLIEWSKAWDEWAALPFVERESKPVSSLEIDVPGGGHIMVRHQVGADNLYYTLTGGSLIKGERIARPKIRKDVSSLTTPPQAIALLAERAYNDPYYAALRLYGSPEAAATAIRNQMATNVEGVDTLKSSQLLMRLEELARKRPDTIAAEMETARASQRNLLFQEAEETPDVVRMPPGTYDDITGVPPLNKMQEEYWNSNAYGVLKDMQDRMTGPQAQRKTAIKNIQLDPQSRLALNVWLEKTKGQQASTRMAAIRAAEMGRDSTLLNYGARYGMDNILQMVVPYQFWFTRSALQWAMRAIDRPMVLANYARLRNFQDKVSPEAPTGYPTRLLGKMRINIPFLPDYMGGGIYTDPMRQMFPIEQMIMPLMSRITNWKNLQEKRANSILERWTEDETITEAQAIQAQAKSGPVWEKAFAQAQTELEDEKPDPGDYVSAVMGMSLPLQMAYDRYRGKTGMTRQLPVTSFIQSITALLGLPKGGLNIEKPIRNLLGMPERGQLFDYYVSRELASMAAEGVIDTQAAMQAMVEKQGPVYQQAYERAAKYSASRNLTATLWGDFFPEGEMEQRQTQAELTKFMDAGGSFSDFLDQHPEYQARMLSQDWESPEGMMRNFLKAQVWEKYLALPALYQKQAQEEFGPTFMDLFLNKETRAYDNIDLPTFASWAKALGAYMPTNAPAVPKGLEIQFKSQEAAQAYQIYKDAQNQVYDEQTAYFAALDAGQKVQPSQNLTDYWDMRRWIMAQYPEIVPYMVQETTMIEGYMQNYLGKNYQQEYGVPASPASTINKADFPPALISMLQGYYYAGQRLGDGARKYLTILWNKYGRPTDTLDEWINGELMTSFR